VSGAAAVITVTALLTVCGLGVLAVVGTADSPRALLRVAGLAPLVGMAWAGIVAATLATAGTRLGIAGLMLLTAGTGVAGAVQLRRARPRPTTSPRHRTDMLDLAVVAAALVPIAIVGGYALAAFRVKPLEEYDGWAMWGMKARAIAVLGSADRAVFASDAYDRLHLEYPLLLPALNSLPLQVAGGFSSNTVVLQCLAIGGAGLLAIWALFRDRVRPALLVGFVAAIAAAPAFFDQLGSGYADVPLALFVAAGLGAGSRWLLDGDTSWLALATLFFAAAAVTKNEGLLFAASAYVPLLAVAAGRRRVVAVSAAIVVLVYAPWRAYTAVYGLEAPDYDLSSSFDLPLVAGRLDRAPVAAAELLEQSLAPQRFSLLLVLGLGAMALALGPGARRLGVLAAGFTLLSLAGLTWIYVISPYDVTFYLSTNSRRVVMSLVLGVATLSPLLIEESARAVSRRRASGRLVGTPR
jgi:hypothetical protein